MTPTRAGRTRWSLARLPLRSVRGPNVRGPNVRMRGQPTKLNQTKPNEETRSSVSLQPKEDGASEKKQNKKHSKCERYAFTSKFANQKRFTLRRTPKVKQNYFRNRTQSAPTWTHPSCKRRATAAPPIDERLLAFLFVCLFCLLIFSPPHLIWLSYVRAPSSKFNDIASEFLSQLLSLGGRQPRRESRFFGALFF